MAHTVSKIDKEIRYVENEIKISTDRISELQEKIKVEQNIILKCTARIDALKWVLEEIFKKNNEE